MSTPPLIGGVSNESKRGCRRTCGNSKRNRRKEKGRCPTGNMRNVPNHGHVLGIKPNRGSEKAVQGESSKWRCPVPGRCFGRSTISTKTSTLPSRHTLEEKVEKKDHVAYSPRRSSAVTPVNFASREEKRGDPKRRKRLGGKRKDMQTSANTKGRQRSRNGDSLQEHAG